MCCFSPALLVIVIHIAGIYHLSTVRNYSLLLVSLWISQRFIHFNLRSFLFPPRWQAFLLLSPFTQLFDMMIGVSTASLFDTSLDKLMFDIRTWSNECKSCVRCNLMNILSLEGISGSHGEVIPHVYLALSSFYLHSWDEICFWLSNNNTNNFQCVQDRVKLTLDFGFHQWCSNVQWLKSEYTSMHLPADYSSSNRTLLFLVHWQHSCIFINTTN